MTSTLQINLAPSDYRMAEHLLPHQIAAWRGQVDEILLTVDLKRSKGRFGANWDIGKSKLLGLISDLADVRIEYVDYSPIARDRVEREWCGRGRLPTKDFRGGPSYAYFYGLSAAKGRFIIHSDADIFFGGRSSTWVSEAIELYNRYSDILFLGALSGPPNAECRILSLPCQQSSRAHGGHVFDFMSTRFFMIDRVRFKEKVGMFAPSRPSLRSVVKAFVEGNPMWDLPEHWMTKRMQESKMCRFEFLGEGSGMWYLHPPYRCDDFFAKIDWLIRAVEKGELPDSQRGYHDFTNSMVDWSEAIEKLKRDRWWKRILR